MLICFVSLIALYEIGFDKLEELPYEIVEAFDKTRQNEILNMMELQFVLSYKGNISKQDSDEMTPFELGNWYEFLKKQVALDSGKP